MVTFKTALENLKINIVPPYETWSRVTLVKVMIADYLPEKLSSWSDLIYFQLEVVLFIKSNKRSS